MMKTNATYNLQEMDAKAILKMAKFKLEWVLVMVGAGRGEEAQDLYNQVHNALTELEQREA